MRRPSHVVDKVLWIVFLVSGGEGCTGYLQDAEKVRQRRSRLIEILNVPERARLRFRYACGLAGRHF